MRSSTAIALFGAGLAALLALQGTSSLAAHPTGAVDRTSAKKAGIRADVTSIGCLDCHLPHGALSESIVAEGAETAGCLSCHQAQADQRKDQGHPWDVRVRDSRAVRSLADQGLRLGPGDTVACLSCHGVHEARDADASCADCHRQQTPRRSGTDVGHSQVACLDCHLVHPGIGNTAGLRPAKGDPSGCLTCHAPGKKAQVQGVEPGRLGHPVAGATLDTGEAMSCRTCHDAHRPGLEQSATCASCHEDQDKERARGGHGDTVCQDCHPVHQRSPMEGVSVTGADLNPRSLACMGCHAKGSSSKATKVESYDHPSPVFDLTGKRWTPLGRIPLFAADGTALKPGENGELTCSSCHTTHGPESARTVDHLRRSDWEDACSSCHGDDALLLYRYFHRPDRRPKVDKPGR